MNLRIGVLLTFSIIFVACSGAVRKERAQQQHADHTCENIVSAARPWMGTPYQYGGNTLSGTDCSGFVQQMYQQVFAHQLPRTTKEMFARGSFVRSSWLKCGDLLFFKNVRGRGVDHVGIYVGNDRFIHASSSRGVIISLITSDYYSSRFTGARRYF